MQVPAYPSIHSSIHQFERLISALSRNRRYYDILFAPKFIDAIRKNAHLFIFLVIIRNRVNYIIQYVIDVLRDRSIRDDLAEIINFYPNRTCDRKFNES